MTTTDTILAAKYPAKAHARRVAESIKARQGTDNDEPQPFRQRRPFFYLTGCLLPDASVVYDVNADQLTLFIPPIDPESVIWSGLPLSLDDASKLYDVDRVLYTTDVNATLASISSSQGGKAPVFAIEEQVSSEVKFHGFSATNLSDLKEVIGDERVVKDAYEIALLRKANEISGKAHVAAIKAGQTATNEREVEAAFIGTCYANESREQSYHGIFASGEGGATLHYTANDKPLIDSNGQRKKNMLIDAAGEYQTYCADITRVIPLDGKFNEETRQIYKIVLEMQEEAIAVLKAGVKWDDVHALTHRVAIRGLLKLGILRGSEDEIFDKRVSVAFFPHGLGHYLGMDTHDTGGHPNYEDTDKMFRYLRVRVEPGIYFCRFIIDPVLKDAELSKYIDTAVLDRYWSVGGVRIEDNLHITKDGSDNLTTAPKALAEVESLAQ
ncbi:hypothetical protein N7468_005723 [Penicillium chermesinum]|uniref:Probable Xaa-Pro aminopeptidase PEPP n=1 Tax=Penicillium chermesinum TaxID=63820 RepID=A0A9W9P272_9EURO|nr:uncharacterized protein N7468_005723 [Penicillium chermesinum]KAJ5232767.1 hypothetical protein N7468_005723 [Penicillium chermesinum]